MEAEPLLFFNGINGESGEYDIPPMSAEELAGFIQGEQPAENLSELRFRYQQGEQTHLGVKEGVDPTRLEEAGWGVIFAHDADPAVKEALGELLAWREELAGDYFTVFEGRDGHRPGESKSKFLARHGAGPGPADPKRVPYYLLIVGDPARIPYLFQSQLDVQYAVGRIYFETPQEYANYARSVVEAERKPLKMNREAAIFATANPGDKATQKTLEELVDPMSISLASQQPDWTINTYFQDHASKDQLARLLGGEQTPAFLFSSNQGLWLPNGSARQLSHTGALITSEWPGPKEWRERIPEDFYFAADDLSAEASLRGLIAFFFSCYSVGTPLMDDFARRAFKDREQIAPHAFLAQLPSRMLSHPRGGALAVIGHIERVWGYSFFWAGAGRQTEVFESTLRRLMAGHPVGSAVEYFNERYAELSTVLSDELEEIEFGKTADPYELAGLWTANNDARGYAILGDPAVRMSVNGSDPGNLEQRELYVSTVETPPVQFVESRSYLSESRRILVSRFSREELEELAFSLDVNWDDLKGDTVSRKAQSLINYLNRRSELGSLSEAVQRQRPGIDWPALPVRQDTSGEGGLLSLLIQHFSLDELRLLVFDLGDNWDVIPGENLSEKARELIIYLIEQDRLNDLQLLASKERPNVDWFSAEVPRGLLPDGEYSESQAQQKTDDSYPTDVDLALDSPSSVWWYMGDGTSESQLSYLTIEDNVTWGANSATKAGDIVLMYLTAPVQEITYLFKAKNDARAAEITDDWQWDNAIDLTDKLVLDKPLPRRSILAHPGLKDWTLAQNPQGALRRVKDIRGEGQWEKLRSLLVAWNPGIIFKLAEWEGETEDVIEKGVLELAQDTSTMLETSHDGIVDDPGDLLPLFSQALILAPDTPRLLTGRADIYVRIGDLDAAVIDLEESLTQQPDNAWSHFVKALVHRGKEETREALSEYGQALKLEPDNAVFLISRGQMYQEIGRFRQAKLDYDRVLANFPDDDFVYYLRAILSQEEGEPDLAIQDLDAAISLRPEDPVYLQVRAILYQNAERFGEALEDLDHLLEIEGPVPWTYLGRGDALLGLGRDADALNNFSRAIEEEASYATEVLEKIRQNQQLERQGAGLRQLAMTMAAADQYEEAEQVTDMIADPGERALALADLTISLSPADDQVRIQQLTQEISSVLDGIISDREQRAILARINTQLEANGLGPVEPVARLPINAHIKILEASWPSYWPRERASIQLEISNSGAEAWPGVGYPKIYLLTSSFAEVDNGVRRVFEEQLLEVAVEPGETIQFPGEFPTPEKSGAFRYDFLIGVRESEDAELIPVDLATPVPLDFEVISVEEASESLSDFFGAGSERPQDDRLEELRRICQIYLSHDKEDDTWRRLIFEQGVMPALRENNITLRRQFFYTIFETWSGHKQAELFFRTALQADEESFQSLHDLLAGKQQLRWQAHNWGVALLYLDRLTGRAAFALKWAAGYKEVSGPDRLSITHVLNGLFQDPEGDTFALLTLFTDKLIIEDQIQEWSHDAQSKPLDPVTVQAASFDDVSWNMKQTDDQHLGRLLSEAAKLTFAREERLITARDLLAGLLARSNFRTAGFIENVVGLPAQQLFKMIIDAGGDPLPLETIREQSVRPYSWAVKQLAEEDPFLQREAVANYSTRRYEMGPDRGQLFEEALRRDLAATSGQLLEHIRLILEDEAADSEQKKWLESLMPPVLDKGETEVESPAETIVDSRGEVGEVQDLPSVNLEDDGLLHDQGPGSFTIPEEDLEPVVEQPQPGSSTTVDGNEDGPFGETTDSQIVDNETLEEDQEGTAEEGQEAPPDPATVSGGPEAEQELALAAPSSHGIGPRSLPVTISSTRFQHIVEKRSELPPPKRGQLSLEIGKGEILLRFHQENVKAKRYVSPHSLGLKDFTALEIDADFTAYGGQLFDRLFLSALEENVDDKKSARTGYWISRSHGRNQFDIELFINPLDAELHGYLWEYLLESGTPLAVREGTPFYRRVYGESDIEPVTFDHLKVLVAICNPISLGEGGLVDFEPLNEEVELQAIEKALKPLQEEGHLEYQVLLGSGKQSATIDNIRERLQEGFHVLHILSHGFPKIEKNPETDEDEEKFYLLMEREERQIAFVDSGQVNSLVQAGNDLRLVVLAACDSAGSQTEKALRGLGPLLVSKSPIPAVVAMQRKISDVSARTFAAYFYDDLLRSGMVQRAMAATRLAMYQIDQKKPAGQRTHEWGIPVLYLGEDTDGQILVHTKTLQDALQGRKPMKMPDEMTPGQMAAAGLVEQPLDTVLAEAIGQGGPAAMLAQMIMASPTLTGVGEEEKVKGQSIKTLSGRINKLVSINAGRLKVYIEGQTGLQIRPRAYNQIASALSTGKHIILTGPPGTGKTSLAQAICHFAAGVTDSGEKRPDSDEVMSAGTKLTTAVADWTTFDTIGGYVPTKQGTLQFRPGILLEAVRDGHWLVIDEINRAEIDKAFGELFTLLSGQQVDLSYQVDQKAVRILPSRKRASGESDSAYLSNWWPPDRNQGRFDYVIHPNWRIIGTMNVYDRSFLFQLSLAFMRRFAFIDLGLPEHEIYEALCRRWLSREFISHNLPLAQFLQAVNSGPGQRAWRISGNDLLALSEELQPDGQAIDGSDSLLEQLLEVVGQPAGSLSDEDKETIGANLERTLNDPELAIEIDSLVNRLLTLYPRINPLKITLLKILNQKLELMIRRGIGPAIALDMIRYLAQRISQADSDGGAPEPDEVIAEAFLLYVVPQLDGLDQESIQKIYAEVELLFAGADGIQEDVLESIRTLYLHIQAEEWAAHLQDLKASPTYEEFWNKVNPPDDHSDAAGSPAAENPEEGNGNNGQ